jgi:hypothetical protein
LNDKSKKVFEFYIEFAKADSKLACIKEKKDFDHLVKILENFSNIFEKNFGGQEYINIFTIFLQYQITYFNSLKKLVNNNTSDYQLIKDKIEEFQKTKNVQYAEQSIMYLRTEINKLENSKYNATPRTIQNRTKKLTNDDNNKIKLASNHFNYFYDKYNQYHKLKTKYKLNSNITAISEFHQALTHFSRYVISGNLLEVFRFDSHIIRAIFDLQKLIIASLLKNIKNNTTHNQLLVSYVNVKNIEVSGRNMTNFDEVYKRYNAVIDKIIIELDK